MVTETRQKQLPHSREAEEAILGSILLNNKVMYDLIDLISDEDFYIPECRTIYKHVREMWDRGDAIDVITLQESLKRNKDLERIGGPVYVDHLFDEVPASENFRHYARILRDNAFRRQVVMLGQELSDYGYNTPENEDLMRDKVGQKFIDLSHDSKGKGHRSMSDVVDKLVPELEKRMIEKGFSGLKTGYGDIDAKLGGLQKSDLVILAARPSVGKTALALNIAENIAREDGKVLFFSLEMPAEQLALRLLTSISGVNSERIRKGEISEKDYRDKLSPALNDMDKMNIFIVENPAITPLQIRAEARRVRIAHGGHIDLIIVDYLQLIYMPYEGRYDGRVQEVSEISRSMKSLARELQTPVLAISQLSRESEKQNRAPKLSDLRESGALEQDADVVMFIHREQKDKEELVLDGKIDAELIIAKHRNGPTGRVKMKFEKARTRFYAAPQVKDAGFDDEGYMEDDL